MTSDLNRRHFLQTASHTAATLAAVRTLPGVFAAESSQAETVNIALIGCGSIMTHHLKGLVSRKEAVSISRLCDVDPAQIDRIAKNMQGFQSQAPNRTSKSEDVLADPNVDAVIVATPHHWHAPIAINAMAE
ncbi:MAG: Gfo/Idh/MocA family oxidoreductase, partial [Fuerstiella sp.]|nr:Gfo/Idh/MocA family oxidoreductase [Fuerstiella sp.]